MDISVIKNFLTACHEAKRITELMPPLPEGMTARHIYVIDAVWQCKQEKNLVKVSDVSDYLRVTRPSITKLIQELETLQVIEKFPDANDKRVVLLQLTDLGLQYYKFYVEQYQSWLYEKLKDIRPEDFQVTIGTIDRVYSVMRMYKMEDDAR